MRVDALVGTLARALSRRSLGAPVAVDDAVLTGIVGGVIEIDDPDSCASAVLDLGPITVLEALQNGARWDGFVERLARPRPVGIVAASTGARRSPDARELLRWLHLCTGTAPLALVRSVASPGFDLDTAVHELTAAGVVRVSRPADLGTDSAGTRLSVTFGHLGEAADELRSWATEDGADLIPGMAEKIDEWIRTELSSAPEPLRTPTTALALRRHGLVALGRLAASGRWSSAVDIAESLAGPLSAVGLHRALHREVKVVLERASSSASASEDVRRRLRLVSAELYFASGDLDLCSHLLGTVSDTESAGQDLRWRARLTSAIWAPGADPAVLLGAIASYVLSGGSHTLAAEVTLDLAARLLRDDRHGDADDVLTAAGAYAAVAGNDVLVARLHVTTAVLRSKTGDVDTGRRRLTAAYPLAAARGDYTFVHVVSSCTGYDRTDHHADGGSHLAEVAELLSATTFDVDHRGALATAVADHGPGWIGRRPDRRSPLLRSVEKMYGAAPGKHPVGSTEREPAPSDLSDRADLTDREVQVVELVAEGKSNSEIGDELGISRWTVVSHMRNIMRKWDCTSRVEVALKHRA